MWGWVLLILLVVFIAMGPFVVTQQQNAKIIERLGKFRRVTQPGLSLKIPLIDRVVRTLELRIRYLEANLEMKTKDNVFVHIVVATQFRVDPQQVKRAFYELSNPQSQIQSYIADAIRSSIPTLNLDEVFETKDEIAAKVQGIVSEGMAGFGFIIVKTLITSIDPDIDVKNSMNAINAAQRQKMAARELAEADRVQIEIRAQAQAEESRLRGLGLAQQREEIIRGISSSITELQKFGITEDQIITLLMLNQYMDTLGNFAANGNSTLMLPGTPSGVADLQTQLLQSLMVGNKMRDNM
jgi:regulator of protease activity HflC (stomatin/prohibitin superfamily)